MPLGFLAPFRYTLQAIRVQMMFRRLKRHKINGIRKKQNLAPILSLWQQFVRAFFAVLKLILGLFIDVNDVNIEFVKRSRDSTFGRVFMHGTFESGVAKNILGFLTGITLSWIIFLFVFYQTDANRLNVIAFGVSTLLVLSFGLSTSSYIRNIVALMLPTVLSSKGRLLILGYVLILTFNGPVKNISYNMDEMSRSISCGKQLAANITKQTVKEVLSPLVVVKNAIKKAVETMKQFVVQIKEAFLTMKELFKQITISIKHIFSWLKNIVSICNEKLGKPYKKCTNAFDDAIDDCRRRMGWFFRFLCNVVKWVRPICEVARIGELLCKVPEFIKKQIIDKVNEAFGGFLDDIYNEFYVKVSFKHHYNYSFSKSKTYEAVLEGLKADIHKKFLWIIKFINFFSLTATLLSLYVIFKAVLYRWKYLKNDAFDNRYITKHFREIDIRRALMSKETVLPLNYRERKRYILTTSLRMAADEKKKLSFGITSFITPAYQSIFFMLMDYLLYKTMLGVRHLIYTISLLRIPARGELHVKGYGALADMYRNIGNDLNPMSQIEFKKDMSCTPSPKPPDYDSYQRIVLFLVIALLSAFVEAYTLRSRHVVMAIFFPKRSKQRAAWLYSQVLCQRGDFMKYMRRQLRRKILGDSSIEKISLIERLCARYPFLQRIQNLFTAKKSCVMCAEKPKSEEDERFKQCENSGCPGFYCKQCFSELENKCTLCKRPVEYADASDISEEVDSSEEELEYDYNEDWSYQDDTASESSVSVGEIEKRIKKQKVDYTTYTDLLDTENYFNEVPEIIPDKYESIEDIEAKRELTEEKHDLDVLAKELNIEKSEILRMKFEAKRLLEDEEEDIEIKVEPNRNETRKIIAKAKSILIETEGE